MRELAQKLWENYINGIIVEGFDIADLKLEIDERPNRNSFVALQARAWERLRECFIAFQTSDIFTRFFEGNLPLRQSSPIMKAYEQLARLRYCSFKSQTLVTD